MSNEKWYASKGSTAQGLVSSEQDGRNIAVTYGGYDNALLIAQAPAMRGLLEKIANKKYDNLEQIEREAWAIISEIEGEGT